MEVDRGAGLFGSGAGGGHEGITLNGGGERKLHLRYMLDGRGPSRVRGFPQPSEGLERRP
jgi:hypothetical protein